MRTLFLFALLLTASACAQETTRFVDVPPADDGEGDATRAATSNMPAARMLAAPERPVPEPAAKVSAPPGASVDPNECGCSLCKPVFSDDACETDADCAPSQPCHAEACVAKSKAQPPHAGVQCTDSFACLTADANACGCVQGRCALYPN